MTSVKYALSPVLSYYLRSPRRQQVLYTYKRPVCTSQIRRESVIGTALSACYHGGMGRGTGRDGGEGRRGDGPEAHGRARQCLRQVQVRNAAVWVKSQTKGSSHLPHADSGPCHLFRLLHPIYGGNRPVLCQPSIVYSLLSSTKSGRKL